MGARLPRKASFPRRDSSLWRDEESLFEGCCSSSRLAVDNMIVALCLQARILCAVSCHAMHRLVARAYAIPATNLSMKDSPA